MRDLVPAKCLEIGVTVSWPEFQRNAAWPEKDVWTNANADKMAAVAKLTREEEDGADTLWMLFESSMFIVDFSQY